MLKKERHAHIVKQINLHNKVYSADLAIQLNISEDTVRRDLNELADTGQIVKVHGGALSSSFHYPFKNNTVYAAEAKKKIAKKAINLIKDDMLVLTGGGTTIIEMARLLPKKLRATIYTISPLVALQLVDHQFITVVLIGGQLSKESQVCTGTLVINYLADIRFDICFMGTNCISIADALTDSDMDVVQVKKAMIRASNKLVVMCIAEKLNSMQRMRVCGLSQINALITDLDIDAPALTGYKESLTVL